MRKHYESLNYISGQPNLPHFRVTRTQGSNEAIYTRVCHNFENPEYWLGRDSIVALRDMLNEVLEDWA